MAYDYNKIKTAYEALNDTQKQQFAQQTGGNVQQFLKDYQAEQAKASTPKTSTTSTNVAKPEYQGSGTTGTKTSTYTNQGGGNYTYNPQTGYYEKQGNKTPAATSADLNKATQERTAELNNRIEETNRTINEAMGTATKLSGGTTPDLAKFWNDLSYQQQQDYLNKNPNLKQSVVAKGLTIKSKPAETPTTEGGETPKQGEWDYQDNSPERMKQMADNVNQFYASDPWIFNSEDSFRKFFIDGKGRTKEQEQFLMDLYKNREKYNELDGYTADKVGSMDAHGQIPSGYLTYLKNTDPERYAAVMDAKAKSEDKIKDEAALDTINSMNGEWGDTSTGKVIEWLKANGLLVDKDGNLVDDRREHYASEEENKYLKELADLAARNLEIDNIVKHSYDDLVERYPGASKGTLMAMAQDINSDLLREKENNLVEMTRYQGYVDYMQDERFEMNAAGADTIAQLQKDYGMYYQYSTQGMSELAQAQYAATNVTLDQADKGTYTQKQMALESVLSPIYQQYGNIIERPMAQVINDVIAYAQNKGISLSKALEENFMTPLKSKPAYTQLSSAEPYTIKVGDVAYQYNFETGEFTPIGGTGTGLGTGLGGYQFGESIRTGDTIGNDINSIGHILASDDGLRVGTYKSTNGYTYNVYADREDGIKATENLLRRGYYGMTLADAAQKWIGQGKDISAAKKVISDEGLSLNDKLSDENVRKFIEAMGTWEGTLKGGQSLDDWAKSGKNDFSEYRQRPTTEVDNQNQKFSNLTGWNNDGYSNSLVKDYEQYISDPSKVSKTDIESKYAPIGMTYYDFTTQAQNYARTGMKDKYVNSVSSSLEAAVELYEYINGAKSGMTWGDFLTKGPITLFDMGNAQKGLANKALAYMPGTKQRDAKSYFDALNNRETLQKLIETKAQGATYGAMSEGEWKLLASAANLLDRNQSGDVFQKNLENLIYALSTAVEEGGGKLPTNFYKSSASNMIMQGENAGRRNAYKEDNSPFYADIDYSSYSTSGPSEI